MESTVRDGFFKEFFIVVVKDCVAARSLEEQNDSLSYMEKIIAKVVTSEEIISAWQNPA